MLAAREWLWKRLKNRDRVAQRTDELMLTDIDMSAPEGQATKALSDRLLVQLSSTVRDRITLAQVRQCKAEYAKRFPNGDGVVPKAHVEEVVEATTEADAAAAAATTAAAAPGADGNPAAEAKGGDKKEAGKDDKKKDSGKDDKKK